MTVHVTGDVASEFACSECKRAFVPLRKDQVTCGDRACIKARSMRREREKRGGDVVPLRERRLTCPHCQEEFTPNSPSQVTCEAKKCRNRQDYIRDRARPSYVEKNRERCRQWYERKREAAGHKPQPWLKSAPAYGDHLPGAGLEIHISPQRYPITLQDTRALHAIITHLLDRGHGQAADFALLPWPRGCQWAVYLASDDAVGALAGKTFEGRRLFDSAVSVRFGYPVRLKTPRVEGPRGRRRLTIDTVTPVVIRSMGSKVARAEVSDDNIQSTLAQTLARRIGLRTERPVVRAGGEVREVDGLPIADVPCEVVSSSVVAVKVNHNKLGTVTGWEGRVVVETNAVGEWLLRCAASGMGLGGRVGFGYGRIRVTAGEPTSEVIAGPWFVTPHAVERYKHWARFEGSDQEALGRIVNEARRAHHVKKLESGTDLWRGPGPQRLRYIVGPGEGELPALITVMPTHDGLYEGEKVAAE